MKPNLDELATECLKINDPTASSGQYMSYGFKQGYTRAIADVVEWLKGEFGGDFYAEAIENKFLKGENEKRVVTDTERLDWLLKNDATVIVGNSRQAIDTVMKGEK